MSIKGIEMCLFFLSHFYKFSLDLTNLNEYLASVIILSTFKKGKYCEFDLNLVLNSPGVKS